MGEISQQMSREQVSNLLKHVDSKMEEGVKREIFERLGHECFHGRHLDKWIDQFKGDVRNLQDYVNVQGKSKYWESLALSRNKKRIVLTGKEVEGCACAFADCENPPLSLCRYCCKNFQQAMFGYLLGKKVEVTITEGFLLGDKRCSTIIEIK
jgi:hypothetical protein